MVEDLKNSVNEGAPIAVDIAVQLLTAPSALAQLSLAEAHRVVSFMKPAHFDKDARFIQEGDAADSGFLALVIEGEVIVENITVSRTEPITTAILGPGSLVGEMGLLDNGPRSASCTASTELYCAVLTREAFTSMIQQEPTLGLKLMLGVSIRITERLRETSRKLKLYANLCKAMQGEIDRLMRELDRKPLP